MAEMDIVGGGDGKEACAWAGCGNPGTMWIEIHDRAAPERIRVCMRHHDDTLKRDVCTTDGCAERAERKRKCGRHAEPIRQMYRTSDGPQFSKEELRLLKRQRELPKPVTKPPGRTGRQSGDEEDPALACC